MPDPTDPDSRPTRDDSPPGCAVRLVRAAWTLLLAGVLVYGLGTASYLLARLLVGEGRAVVALANNFVPWLALGGLIAAGIALFSRWRWPLIAAQVPILAAFAILFGDLFWPPGAPSGAEEGRALRVAAYNVQSSRSDPAAVRRVVDALDADLIGLEELGPEHARQIEQALGDEYPYRVLYPALPYAGSGLLSRYPVLEQERITPFPDSMYYVRAVLDVDGTPVTVYVVHPPPPAYWTSPLTYSGARRDAELAILREDYLIHEDGPLLVIGDFNLPDQSDAYRALDRLLEDSFREAGSGLGLTFPTRLAGLDSFPRLLRIDYIWHSAHFVAQDAHPWNDSGTSDHRPVIARLVLKNS